jgi:hypothetical protein
VAAVFAAGTSPPAPAGSAGGSDERRPVGGASSDEEPATAVPPGLARLQEGIVRGFESDDADLLASTLSARTKTYVACRSFDMGEGYYGVDQMRLFFRRLFRGRHTVGLRVLEPVTPPRPDGRSTLVTRWSYREPGAIPQDVRLVFTLGREGEIWRVREIRDIK